MGPGLGLYFFHKSYCLVLKRPVPPSWWDEAPDFYTVIEKYTIPYQFQNNFHPYEKGIGKKAYWPLAKLEKGYMFIFFYLLPPRPPPPPQSHLHHCLICSLPWEGDSHGQFEFGQWETQSGYWRARGERCGVFIPHSLLFQHRISGSSWISPQLRLPRGSLSSMAPALTTYSHSIPIPPLRPLHPISSGSRVMTAAHSS